MPNAKFKSQVLWKFIGMHRVNILRVVVWPCERRKKEKRRRGEKGFDQVETIALSFPFANADNVKSFEIEAAEIPYI